MKYLWLILKKKYNAFFAHSSHYSFIEKHLIK